MSRIHLHLPAFALATALVVGGCGSVDKAGEAVRAKPVELVLADHELPDNAKDWAAAVARRSGGTIRIRIAEQWRDRETGYGQAMVGDIRSGKVDLAMIQARAFDEVGVTSLQPLGAPLLIDSVELEQRVLRDDVARQALAGLEPLGLVGLGLVPSELRRPLGITHVLAGPADYRDTMLYAREGKVAADALAALGAAPVRKGRDVWSESVDGAEIGLRAAADAGDGLRYYSGLTANVVLWPQPAVIAIRRQTFEQLSGAQRQALRDATRDVLDTAGRRASATDSGALRDMCTLGLKLVTATPQQLSALRTAFEPVYATIESAPGNAAAIARIRALKGDAAPAPLSCSPSQGRAGASGELDGTYRTGFTEAQLARSPALRDHNLVNGSNWGDFTLRLADGRVRLTQRNRYSSMVRTGTYSVDGDTIRITFADVGQTLALHWTLFRGKLSFVRAASATEEPAFLVKPFERVA